MRFHHHLICLSVLFFTNGAVAVAQDGGPKKAKWSVSEAPRLQGYVQALAWHQGALHTLWTKRSSERALARYEPQGGWTSLGDSKSLYDLSVEGAKLSGLGYREEELACGPVSLEPLHFEPTHVFPKLEGHHGWLARLEFVRHGEKRWLVLDAQGTLVATLLDAGKATTTKLGEVGFSSRVMPRAAVRLGDDFVVARIVRGAAVGGGVSGAVHRWRQGEWTEHALPGGDGGAPTLARRLIAIAAAETTLYCVYLRGAPRQEGTPPGPTTYCLTRSGDGGATWSKPEEVVSVASSLNIAVRVGLVATGSRVAFFAQDVTTWEGTIARASKLRVAASNDRGATWEHQTIENWGGEPSRLYVASGPQCVALSSNLSVTPKDHVRTVILRWE